MLNLLKMIISKNDIRTLIERLIFEKEINQDIKDKKMESEKTKSKENKKKKIDLKDIIDSIANNVLNQIIVDYCFEEAEKQFYTYLYDDNENYLFLDDCDKDEKECEKENMMRGLEHVLPNERRQFILRFCKKNKEKIINQYKNE